MSTYLEVDGLEEMLLALETAPEDVLPLLRGAMRRALLALHGQARIYPPGWAANQPARGRWYQRGYGVRWKTKSGAVHGLKTSERLGARWTYKVSEVRSPLLAIEGVEANNASYALQVKGSQQQARVHRGRWKTLAQDVETVRAAIIAEFDGAVDTWVARFNSGED